MPTLEQARAQLLNRGTSSTATPISPESREVLKTQGGMTDQQIDSVIQSGDFNTTTYAQNQGQVGSRLSDYAAGGQKGSVFQIGPAWFFLDESGSPRQIASGDDLQVLLAAGVPQVANPLGAQFTWEEVRDQYGTLDSGAIQQIVTTRQQAEQQARQAAQQAQNQQQAQAAQRRQLEQSALALAAKDGRTFGSLQQSDPNAYATFLGQYGGDVVRAATAWQAEANNAPLPQQQVAGGAAGQPGNTPTGGRTLTPGLQKWAAAHGGSYNGWDALSDAERAQWESGQAGQPPNKPNPPAANLGGRPDTPGLRRWMAEHGGSMNGWDALTDAQRKAYESGQSITSATAGATTATAKSVDPNASALRPGDQTFFGPIVGDGENGLPQGLGFNWHELRLKAILDLIGADGQMRDPITGQVLQGQQSLAAIKQATDLARQQAQLMGRDAQGNATLEREISEGTLTGKYGGANTLERDKFEESRAQSLYNRAANPAAIFENELARSSGGSIYDTVTGGVNVGQNPASVTPMQPQGVTAAGQSTQTGTFRTPAIINAYRGGLLTPQAGQINAPNTMGTAQDAALGESTVRLANQRTLMSPDQRSMVKSFASAGGVSGDQFDYLEELNKPKGRSISAAVFSGR